jgi:hypothetical protein
MSVPGHKPEGNEIELKELCDEGIAVKKFDNVCKFRSVIFKDEETGLYK